MVWSHELLLLCMTRVKLARRDVPARRANTPNNIRHRPARRRGHELEKATDVHTPRRLCCMLPVAQAAPTVVDLDATNARAAQLRDDLKAVLAGLKTTSDAAQKAQLSSRKFILESQLKMVARLQAAAAK